MNTTELNTYKNISTLLVWRPSWRTRGTFPKIMLSQGPIFTSTPYYIRVAIFNLQKGIRKTWKLTVSSFN